MGKCFLHQGVPAFIAQGEREQKEDASSYFCQFEEALRINGTPMQIICSAEREAHDFSINNSPIRILSQYKRWYDKNLNWKCLSTKGIVMPV